MQLSQRSHSLASCYENALTIILRLSSLQVQPAGNSQDFRLSIRAALKAAMEQAKALGYSSDINQFAFFAAVAFLDESVLKTQNPAFADWAQRPLQDEMFGHNRAGEVFFDHLQTLLMRPDSSETADCLEVYCLCMLLGFKGKYALSASVTSLSHPSAGSAWTAPQTSGEIHALVRRSREKIDRIRGPLTFMPDGTPAEIKRTAAIDRWSRALGIAAIVLVTMTLLAYGSFWLVLSSGVSGIR